MISDDKQEVTLEEIADFQKGFAFKSADFQKVGTKIVKVSNLTLDSIDEDSCICIDNLKASQYLRYELLNNDIVITTVGSWPSNPASVVGKVIRVPAGFNHSLLNQNAVRVRAKKGINQQFLYYLLKSGYFKEYIIGTAQGSANQASITQNDIKAFKYPIPDLVQQEKIGLVLKTIDDKMELNNSINKNLEETAQALFKRWFVDFEFPNENGEPYKSSGGEFEESDWGMIPKGWNIGFLSDILSLNKNSTKAGNHLKNRPYVPIDVIPMHSLSLNSYKSWEEAQSSLITFEKGDILLGAMRVYFHRVAVAPFAGVTRTTCFVLRPKEKSDLGFASLLVFHDDTIKFANSTSQGTTIPYAVWENGLAIMKVVIPASDKRKEFNELINPMLNKFHEILKENIALTHLRDSLLPKLMSGEIRVPFNDEYPISRSFDLPLAAESNAQYSTT
ncbi:restriction endonuclease subunit S [Paenibacillus sp. FSL R10-2779]|uniref:restriction endonuclease subunit S n=1 Tax=Paenibacillus sp. FSL R10-2779 TaxID=2975340 RepID=UPI0030FBAF7A